MRGVVAQLIGGSLFAYCGAKGSPQPPLPEQARHADAGVASDTVPADAGAP